MLTPSRSPARGGKAPANRLLLAGLMAFAVALGGWVIYAVSHPASFTIDPVDLAVYRSGGLIVRHVSPPYNPHLAAPLYDWIGYQAGHSSLYLPFTYTPFAALAFALISYVPWWLSQQLSVAVDIIALLAALWLTLGGLGYRRDKVRVGATLLGTAAVLWTEPVLRTMYLGQVNLVLMALILWDLTQPDTLLKTGKTRWWKGFGTGVAAGIKLTPLIFIPYLLVARKFRQAAMACAGFAFTVLLGFAILPKDSTKWWFDGLFVQSGRTGFAGWAGNQSLEGIITRLTGSVHSAQPAWLVAAVLFGLAGVVAAGLLDRKGHGMLALLTAALTALLVSPISWDHHWVWIAPGVVVAVHYAVQLWRRDRQARRRCLHGAGPGHRGLVRRLADQLVRRQAEPRRRLARPDLDPQEHRPDLLRQVRGQALAGRVSLAWPAAHRRQRLHSGRSGHVRADARARAAAARGQEGARR